MGIRLAGGIKSTRPGGAKSTYYVFIRKLVGASQSINQSIDQSIDQSINFSNFFLLPTPRKISRGGGGGSRPGTCFPYSCTDRCNGPTHLPGTHHDDPQPKTRRPSLRPPSMRRVRPAPPLSTYSYIYILIKTYTPTTVRGWRGFRSCFKILAAWMIFRLG